MKNLIILIVIPFLLISWKDRSLNTNQIMEKKQLKTAVFAGGCFWCTEAIFAEIKGVEKVTSGFTGGKVANPTYQEVCTGSTGHAECIKIEYDPQVVSYVKLLEVFFMTHDPTTLNRQGADVGTQYRSEIFYTDEKQHQEALEVINRLLLEKIWNKPIVTALSPLGQFYSAEGYHQQYYENNPNQGYCKIVITPKVEKFKKLFSDLLKEKK